MNVEEGIGIGAIAFLLFWIWKQRKESGSNTTIVNRAAPNFNAPDLSKGAGFPPGSIYNFPPAPNLNTFVFNPQKPAPTNTGPDATKPVGLGPCECACSSNGASQMVTQTVTNFTNDLTKALGKKFDTYLANISDAVPPYMKQFINNPEAQAASDFMKAQAAKLSAPRETGFKATKITYDPRSDAGKRLAIGGQLTLAEMNINTFVPGRTATLSRI